MRSIAGVCLSFVLLVGLAYGLKTYLPYAPVFTVQWNSQAYYIPFNIAAYWTCLSAGVLASFYQMIRAMLADVQRLR